MYNGWLLRQILVSPSPVRRPAAAQALTLQLTRASQELGLSPISPFLPQQEMGMLYKIPANCTVVSAQQYMYHVQGGSDKVSFSMPSIAEEVTPNSVNITFIQIA